jgi:hypothetical protein
LHIANERLLTPPLTPSFYRIKAWKRKLDSVCKYIYRCACHMDNKFG